MALEDFSRSLPMLLYRSLDAVMPRFRRIFNAHGLTEQQWRVLRVLMDVERAAMRELAAWTSIPAPSLVGVIDRMAKAGYVERQPAEHDRRAVYVVATPAGRRMQQTLAPLVSAVYGDLMQSLPPREWVQLVAGLERLADTGPSPGYTSSKEG